jgi:hypothetical protein
MADGFCRDRFSIVSSGPPTAEELAAVDKLVAQIVWGQPLPDAWAGAVTFRWWPADDRVVRERLAGWVQRVLSQFLAGKRRQVLWSGPNDTQGRVSDEFLSRFIDGEYRFVSIDLSPVLGADHILSWYTDDVSRASYVGNKIELRSGRIGLDEVQTHLAFVEMAGNLAAALILSQAVLMVTPSGSGPASASVGPAWGLTVDDGIRGQWRAGEGLFENVLMGVGGVGFWLSPPLLARLTDDSPGALRLTRYADGAWVVIDHAVTADPAEVATLQAWLEPVLATSALLVPHLTEISRL